MALPLHVVSRITQPQLTAGTLLSSISEIDLGPVTNGDRPVDSRWLNGITWQPEPNFALYSNDVDVCVRVDFTQTPRVCDAAITQSAFSVYDAIKAATIEYRPEEIEEMVLGRVTRKLSAAFARELLAGSISGDRSLSSVAHAPFRRTFASAATPIWYTLAVLEDDLARVLRGTQGTLHLPPGMLGQACTTYGVCMKDDGNFYTPLGNLVISDAGYAGSPQPAGQGANNSLLNDWVYASGPVRYRRSAPQMVDGGNIGSTMTTYTGREDLRSADYTGFRTHDDMTRFADVYGIFQFDTAPVTACLASYEQTDIV